MFTDYGPCPAGYELTKVEGSWLCVKEGARSIAPGTKIKNPIINPCPPGYELKNEEGNWMCVLGKEALTLVSTRGKAAMRIKGGGGGSTRTVGTDSGDVGP